MVTSGSCPNDNHQASANQGTNPLQADSRQRHGKYVGAVVVPHGGMVLVEAGVGLQIGLFFLFCKFESLLRLIISSTYCGFML